MDYKLIVGTDVSKDELDYCLVDSEMSLTEIQALEVSQVSNDVSSLAAWLSDYRGLSVHFVLEPTGSYSDKLMQLLSEYELPFSLVNPHHSHHFSELLGVTSKNDRQAARTLAYMGRRLELGLATAPSKAIEGRKRILSAIYSLDKEIRRISNQLHALAQYKDPTEVVISAYEEILTLIQEKKKGLETELKTLKDAEFDRLKKLAKSVKGVGEKTANWLLTITDGLKGFDHEKQLIKFIGLAPRSHRSGSSVRYRGGITKYGSAQTRACLYMGSISAIKHNKACKEQYERLRKRGKSHYSAMVAVMAKLLKQVFAVVKSEIPFDNDYYLRYKNC